MGRAPCCAKEGLRKGPWSTKEDLLLTNYIKENGEGQWRNLPNKAGKSFLLFFFQSLIFFKLFKNVIFLILDFDSLFISMK